MKRPVFENDCYYHVYNRGVDKRDVFLDDEDYWRFVFSLDEFNDENSTLNILRRLNVNEGNRISFKPEKNEDKEKLVEVVCYCLMPNHYHFILRQIKKGGISKFMQKLGIGYTNYLNQKIERSGVLFQGKFKAALIDKDSYLNYLRAYIHLNPVDLVEAGWKEKGLKNAKKVKEFLKEYKWTDCRNYDQYNEFLSGEGKISFDSADKSLIDY